MIDVLVIPFGLVSGTGQHRYGFLGVLFLCGCELAAADDVVHEAEYALADDFLVNGHVRLEVGNLLLKSLNLGISSVISLFRGVRSGAGCLPLAALLLANFDKLIVRGLLVCFGLLRLLVCGLGGVALAGGGVVLLVCRIVCRLGRCHGSVGGVGLLLGGVDGILGRLQVRLCGGVCSRRGFERGLRGLELTSSSVLGGLKRTQVDTRTRDGSIERGLRLVELLLGVIARGGCGCESSGSLLLLGLGSRQSCLGILLFLLGAGLGSLGLVQIGLCSSNGLIGIIELCLRVLDGLLGGLVLVHTHGLELGLRIVEGLLGLILLCLGVLERLGLILDTLVGLFKLIVQVAQLLLLLLGLFDGGFELVNLLLERGDFCCVLLDFVVAHSLRGLILLLLRLLLRLVRRVGLLLGGIVGGLSVLELLCRLLGQLGSRLYDRLVTGGNGILYRTTPPLNRIAVIG